MSAKVAMRLTLGLAALAIASIAATALSSLDPIRVAARGSGWAAALFLLASLASSPVLGVLRRQPSSLRRALGLAALCFASAHGALALPAGTAMDLDAIAASAQLRAGVTALAILVALALTSFPSFLRIARVRAWSALHRAVYLAGALAALHVLLAPFGSVWAALAYLVALTFALLARLAPRPRSPVHVAERPSATENSALPQNAGEST